MILDFLAALVLTVFIEEAVALLFVRSRSIILPCLCCNLLTNPLLNYIVLLFSLFLPGSRLFVVIALEIAAIVVESFVYRAWTARSFGFCFALSFTANLCSVLVGMWA